MISMSGETRTVDAIRADVERLVGELGTALDELDSRDTASHWGLRARLLRLEAEKLLADRPEGPLSRWEKVGRVLSGLGDFLIKIVPVATPIVLALIAWWVTGTVEAALEVRKVEVAEQQLDLATIQAIEENLSGLRSETVTEQEAEKLAMLTAAFGPRAILPMVMELDLEEDRHRRRADALNHALRMMALHESNRERLCDILRGVNDLVESGYQFEADGKSLMEKLSADVGCPAQ
jgi:hypothetical protein